MSNLLGKINSKGILSKRIKRMLQSIIFITIAVYLGITLLLFIFQKKMIFHPGSTVYQNPNIVNMDFEDLYLECGDGAKINCWFVPCAEAKYTVLFCHGNAGTMAGRVDSIKMLHDIGLNVMIFDYREFGNSKGELTEDGTYMDGEAAWNYLINKKSVSPENIVILGRSLGGGIATNLAVKYKAAALVLESTFMSIREMGKSKYPYLPIFMVIRYFYPNIDNIKKIQIPVFIAHSVDDEIIPYSHSTRLFDAANDPKSFVELDGSHNDCYFLNPEYKTKFKCFIDSL